jgi:hypothetical protein
MHKPAFALALLLIFNGAVYCNDQTSDEIWNTWVPSGWKLLSHAVGNLDQDSTEDAVLVLEEDNPNKRSDTLIGNTTQRSNYNARRLTILIKATSGHRKIVDTDKFLPSQNRESDPCSLFMLKGIEIHHEKLIVSLHHEFACGSGNGTDSKFVFRLQSQRFRLIGFDSTHSSRELNRALSINYLTGDKIITSAVGWGDGRNPNTTRRMRWGSQAHPNLRPSRSEVETINSRYNFKAQR